MTPSPSSPSRNAPGQNNDITTIRPTTFLAAAFLGRPIHIQRRSSNDVEDRAAVSAEIRREGAKAKRQTLDLGKPLGPYDTNSVRERVRKWQAQGGGVVTQPAVVYPPEATPVVSEVGTRDAGGSDVEETDIEILRKRIRRERKKERIAAEKGQEESKDEVVPPRKRVVSDGHWRRKRSPPRRVVSAKGKQPDRSPVTPPDDGIRVKPIREGSERRHKTDVGGTASKDLVDGDDGIRVYVTRKRGDDTRKSSKVVVGDGGIRVYSTNKAGDNGRKVSKNLADGEGKEDQIKRREDDGRKASKASLDGDGNHVHGVKRQESDGGKGSRHSLENDGIRVYSAKRLTSGRQKPRRSTEDIRRSPGSESGGQTDEDRPSPRTTPTAPKNPRKPSQQVETTPEGTPGAHGTPPAEGKAKRRRSSWQKSKTPEDLPRRRESQTADERPKPRAQTTKINVLKEIIDESKKALKGVKAPEQAPPRAPGNRIEAWLSETPDPFVDPPQDPTVPGMPPSEIGQPEPSPVVKEDEDVNVHMSPSKSKRYRHLDSPETVDTASTVEDVRPKSPAQEILDIIESIPQLASPNLKRVGAKRGSPSPTGEKRKSLPVKKPPVQEGEASTPLTSLAAASPSDANSPAIDLQSGEFELPSTLKKRLSTIASVETLNVRATTPPAESKVPTSEVTLGGDRSSEKAKYEGPYESEAGDTFNAEIPEIPGKRSSLKRRLTTHADLISVLSLPRGGNKSIRSARSIRTNRSRLATATIGDLLRELAADEAKYMRELRTLVDGVIPVLLTCALSKSDSAVVAELFNRTADPYKNDPNFTRPIIEMGIALERLKTQHKKIPVHDADELLKWANGTQSVYSEYLKAWRLGFRDVVINLAPGNEAGPALDEQSVYNGLPRDENGDVVDGDGERVDVAFLLKRPLVRLKYLAKTLKGINFIKPSPGAEEQATRYQNLVIDARRRANEERGRLEDEAAANIDATRSRDPRTLGPLTGVSIDRTRRVRARDIFSMDLQHSSGQRMDCKIEMILRDDAPDRGSSGDLLICEVDGTGRWLLFPPMTFRRVSARNGSSKGEIVVMIRGYHGRGEEWQELLILHNDDEQVGFDWVQMLGLTPVPPDIVQRPSFTVKGEPPLHPPSPSSLPGGQPQSPGKSRTPSPREIEVPIGEHARPASKGAGNGETSMPIREHARGYMEIVEEDVESAMSFAEADSKSHCHDVPIHSHTLGESASPHSYHRAAALKTPKKHESPPPVQEDSPVSPVSPVSREPPGTPKDLSISPPSRKTSRQSEHLPEPRYRPPRDLNEAMMMAGGRPPPALKRSKAKRLSRYSDDPPTKREPSQSPQHLDDGLHTRSPTARHPSQKVTDRSPSPTARRPSKGMADPTPSPVRETPIASSKIRVSRGEEVTVSFPAQASAQVERRPSSRDPRLTHREEEEHISRPDISTALRKEMNPASSEEEESPYDDPPTVKHRSPSALPTLDRPTIIKTRRAAPVTPPRSPSRLSSEEAVLGSPASLPDQARSLSTISQESPRERVPESPIKSEPGQEDTAPPPPPHSPSPVQLKGSKTPVFGHPSSAYQVGGRRRSSSPLKHEYEPSSASSSATSESEESENSPAEGRDDSSFSDSSEEEELEDGDAPTPLLPMAALRALGKASPHGSIYSLPNGNFSPTQQAHQAVPQKPAKAFRAIASVFSWSEKGAWEPLHIHECNIAVSPGLIEAFQMSEAHSGPILPSNEDPSGGDNAQQPLVALELTPLVPLRRGTALDISIRSPPIGESKIKVGNNIMFRSCSPEECEALYGAINTSRINNPKYIALQNAIPQHDSLNSFMDRRNSVRGASSSIWSWGWGSNRSSYRANGAMAPSLASSESSIGSFTSAFSALKRFGNGSRLFNISKSTISSRNGSRTGSTSTSSSGASSNFGDGGSGGNGATTPPVNEDPNKGSPIGLSNTKIRLYCRETASKWRDMGSARLTIMRPSIGNKPGPQNQQHQHHHHHEEKRILVTSKVPSAPPLLDVCLSESSFERVARTGIALSVWEERIGENGEVENIPAQGGVGGKTRVYMIQ
ncbi:hypothetical protein GP486_005279, partial [Trichoglossum hirsutum]